MNIGISRNLPRRLGRVVGVEEHVTDRHLVAELPSSAFVDRGYFSKEHPFGEASMTDLLADTEARLGKLDASGVSLQLLSYPMAGADLLPPAKGLSWAKRMNASIANHVSANPGRYAALAHLPLTDPDASADELERTVSQLGFRGALINGATAGSYLDDLSFAPLLARAETLDVPLYLHPAPSPKPAREVLYGGLPDELSFWLSISGWGWHNDTAVHLLRMLLSGVFDRHPKLKIVVGHLGEGLQIMLPRFDQQFHDFAHFKGTPSQLLRKHVWVSMSGFFYEPSFLAALEAFGANHLLYSVDYPFGSLEQGAAFLQKVRLKEEVLSKICHANADLLFGL